MASKAGLDGISTHVTSSEGTWDIEWSTITDTIEAIVMRT